MVDVLLLLLWIGIQLQAPTWFFILTVCRLTLGILRRLLDIWKSFFN